MEKMEKPLSNSPFSPFYAMNFDHRMTYVAAYLGTLTCLFSKHYTQESTERIVGVMFREDAVEAANLEGTM